MYACECGAIEEVVTDDDGRFEVGHVPPGQLRVMALRPWAAMGPYKNAAATVLVDVPADADLSGIQLLIQREGDKAR